jgi:circadian clock protein KaiB
MTEQPRVPGRTEEVRIESVEEFESELAAAARRQGQYQLRLYVSGSTPRSSRAVQNIKRICQQFLEGRYELEVVDVYQQPELAREQHLIAAPTLVKERPSPMRRIVGDMSDQDKVLIGLDLRRRP